MSVIINEKMEQVSVEKLKLHPRNPRKGDLSALRQSVEVNGFYGTIVAQRSTGYILAGNHRYLAAKATGLKDVPVCWVDVDDVQALRILTADNRTSDLGGYDDARLAELLSEVQLQTGGLTGTGYDDADLSALLDDLASSGDDAAREPASEPEEKYTAKIVLPIYEPHGAKPAPSDLVDTTKGDALVAEIMAAPDLPKDIRDFLCAAARRHDVFHFARIAEFYAHSSADVQRLFERSALVIIDFDAAIENGFVRMSERMLELSQIEHNEKIAGYDDEE